MSIETKVGLFVDLRRTVWVGGNIFVCGLQFLFSGSCKKAGATGEGAEVRKGGMCWWEERHFREEARPNWAFCEADVEIGCLACDMSKLKGVRQRYVVKCAAWELDVGALMKLFVVSIFLARLSC